LSFEPGYALLATPQFVVVLVGPAWVMVQSAKHALTADDYASGLLYGRNATISPAMVSTLYLATWNRYQSGETVVLATSRRRINPEFD